MSKPIEPLEDAPTTEAAIAVKYGKQEKGSGTSLEADDLWSRYMGSDDPRLREELILRYAPLVKRVIGHMAIHTYSILEYEDIVSCGTLGLMRAVDRYNPSRGVAFEVFATKHIRGSVIDALRKITPLSRVVTKKIKERESAIAVLEQEYQRAVSDMEIADYLNISPKKLQKTRIYSSYTFVPLSGQTRISHGDGSMLVEEVIADEHCPDPLEVVEDQEIRRALLAAIGELSERDRQVLSLYYGSGLHLYQIGEVLGISSSRATQLHTRAIVRLREVLQANANHADSSWKSTRYELAA